MSGMLCPHLVEKHKARRTHAHEAYTKFDAKGNVLNTDQYLHSRKALVVDLKYDKHGDPLDFPTHFECMSPPKAPTVYTRKEQEEHDFKMVYEDDGDEGALHHGRPSTHPLHLTALCLHRHPKSVAELHI